MSLPRQSLMNAIRAGLRRSSGKDLEAQVAAVLDAIDITEEIQAGAEARFNPAPASEPSPDPQNYLPPPPNPASVEKSKIIETTLAPQPSRVTLATDQQATAAIKDHKAKSGLRVKSTFLGGGRNRMSLVELSNWAHRAFPLTIRVVPNGMDQEIELERNIYTIPLMGERENREKESVVKVVYKHPKLGSDMEVGSHIRVADAQQDTPNVESVLAEIRKNASELYKVRPQMIEGVEPKGPALEGQHRQQMILVGQIDKATSVLVAQGVPQEQARSQAEAQIRNSVVGKGGRQIVVTLADAE